MTNIKKISLRVLMGLFTVLIAAGCANMDKMGMDKLVILDGDLSFAFGSDQLTPAGKSQINQLTDSLMNRGEVYVEVIGHTDRIGNAKANQNLSLRRAQAVRNQLLMSRLKPDSIVARGVGSKFPVAKNCNQKNEKALIACLAPDRRVEMKISDMRW